MVARFRTNVLKREEKGIGPISFPRLLIAGLGAVFSVMGLGRATNFTCGCVGGIFIMFLVIFITQPVSGTPMGQFLAKFGRGLVVVNGLKAKHDEGSSPILDVVSSMSGIDGEEGILNCDVVFDVPEEGNEEEEALLLFFRDAADSDKGLQVLDNPFGA